ncbi:hypothetical protein D3C71_1755480 [compost metagenome]
MVACSSWVALKAALAEAEASEMRLSGWVNVDCRKRCSAWSAERGKAWLERRIMGAVKIITKAPGG